MKQMLLVLWIGLCCMARGADYAVIISIDGLGSKYLQEQVKEGILPSFKRLQEESAGTLNARADYDITVTLPNHTSMVTSRRITGKEGHNWTHNTDPAKGMTLHANKGSYVAGVFDVAHDHGLSTGLWATKTKFSLFPVSYNATNGAPDVTGTDNGRNKVDLFVYEKSSQALTDRFLDTMSTRPCRLSFVHFGEGDAAGHAHGWGSQPYVDALILIDQQLGRILSFISSNPTLKGKTDVIVTADHGGVGNNHGDAEKPLDYTIPFYVRGPDVTIGDLYALNQGVRLFPDTGRPGFEAALQPVRNGEAGNLALSLLGLPPIPGSGLNAKQDLRVKR